MHSQLHSCRILFVSINSAFNARIATALQSIHNLGLVRTKKKHKFSRLISVLNVHLRTIKQIMLERWQLRADELVKLLKSVQWCGRVVRKKSMKLKKQSFEQIKSRYLQGKGRLKLKEWSVKQSLMLNNELFMFSSRLQTCIRQWDIKSKLFRLKALIKKEKSFVLKPVFDRMRGFRRVRVSINCLCVLECLQNSLGRQGCRLLFRIYKDSKRAKQSLRRLEVILRRKIYHHFLSKLFKQLKDCNPSSNLLLSKFHSTLSRLLITRLAASFSLLLNALLSAQVKTIKQITLKHRLFRESGAAFRIVKCLYSYMTGLYIQGARRVFRLRPKTQNSSLGLQEPLLFTNRQPVLKILRTDMYFAKSVFMSLKLVPKICRERGLFERCGAGRLRRSQVQRLIRLVQHFLVRNWKRCFRQLKLIVREQPSFQLIRKITSFGRIFNPQVSPFGKVKFISFKLLLKQVLPFRQVQAFSPERRIKRGTSRVDSLSFLLRNLEIKRKRESLQGLKRAFPRMRLVRAVSKLLSLQSSIKLSCFHSLRQLSFRKRQRRLQSTAHITRLLQSHLQKVKLVSFIRVISLTRQVQTYSAQKVQVPVPPIKNFKKLNSCLALHFIPYFRPSTQLSSIFQLQPAADFQSLLHSPLSPSQLKSNSPDKTRYHQPAPMHRPHNRSPSPSPKSSKHVHQINNVSNQKNLNEKIMIVNKNTMHSEHMHNKHTHNQHLHTQTVNVQHKQHAQRKIRESEEQQRLLIRQVRKQKAEGEVTQRKSRQLTQTVVSSNKSKQRILQIGKERIQDIDYETSSLQSPTRQHQHFHTHKQVQRTLDNSLQHHHLVSTPPLDSGEQRVSYLRYQYSDRPQYQDYSGSLDTRQLYQENEVESRRSRQLYYQRQFENRLNNGRFRIELRRAQNSSQSSNSEQEFPHRYRQTSYVHNQQDSDAASADYIQVQRDFSVDQHRYRSPRYQYLQ